MYLFHRCDGRGRCWNVDPGDTSGGSTIVFHHFKETSQ